MIGVIALSIIIALFSVYLYFLGKEGKSTNSANLNTNITKTSNINSKAGANVNYNQNINVITNNNSVNNINTDTAVNTAYSDSDNDGLTDAQEKIYGTNPNKLDTDSDGLWDGQEVSAGTDPLVANNSNTNTINMAGFNLTTTPDKEVYKAKENITLTVKLKSNKDINNVFIQSVGVRGKSYDYFNQSKTVNLEAGVEQTVGFTSPLPSCSSCSGVSPGTYSITTSVSANNQVIASRTISFILQQ